MGRFLIAIALFLCTAQPVFAKDVTIAVAGPFSGSYASFGEQFKRGAEMAIADINAAGGVLGQKIKVVYGDDGCDPKQAVTVANKLVASEVPVVFGHFCSGSSIPASDVYNEENVLMISPGSSHPQLTDAGRWNVFRVVARDDKQSAVAADYIVKHFNGKNIAIVHDKQTYSKGLADGTKNLLNKAGVHEVLDDTVNVGEKDFSAFVSKLKENNIDLLYYGGYHTEAGLIVRQMRDQGLKTILMGGDALVTKEFWAITGKSGNGTLVTYPPDPRLDPKNAALVKRFKDTGYDPEGYTLYTYAAIQLWADAVNKSGSAEGKKLASYLKAHEFDTTLGKVSFDEKGDIKGLSHVVYEWRDGQYSYMK